MTEEKTEISSSIVNIGLFKFYLTFYFLIFILMAQ